MSVIDKVKDTCINEREKAYGHPLQNHQSIGLIWTGIMGAAGLLKDDKVISPEIAALCMLGVKLSRESFSHGEDNVLDMYGYVHCLERIKQKKEQNEAGLLTNMPDLDIKTLAQASARAIRAAANSNGVRGDEAEG